MFRRWRNRARFLPSLGREEKWLIDMNQSTKTVVHTTDRTYVCRKQGLATADVIDFQPVKHPASYAGNRLVGRAIIRRDWGTGTSIYPAHPSAQATLSFAMISRENEVLTAKNAKMIVSAPKNNMPLLRQSNTAAVDDIAVVPDTGCAFPVIRGGGLETDPKYFPACGIFVSA